MCAFEKLPIERSEAEASREHPRERKLTEAPEKAGGKQVEKEVEKAARQRLDDATIEPSGFVEGKADYKQAEDIQGKFAAVSENFAAGEARGVPEEGLGTPEQLGKATGELGGGPKQALGMPEQLGNATGELEGGLGPALGMPGQLDLPTGELGGGHEQGSSGTGGGIRGFENMPAPRPEASMDGRTGSEPTEFEAPGDTGQSSSGSDGEDNSGDDGDDDDESGSEDGMTLDGGSGDEPSNPRGSILGGGVPSRGGEAEDVGRAGPILAGGALGSGGSGEGSGSDVGGKESEPIAGATEAHPDSGGARPIDPARAAIDIEAANQAQKAKKTAQ